MKLPEQFTPKLITAFREGYGAAQLRADLIAGLTVAIVAVPLAMALGIASGAPPREGLVTAVIAGFLISALGGSRVQIGGPTGAFVVIVAGVIATHGFDGLILATLMAGAILIVSGYAGVGRLMRYVPMPVVTGFTAGIAVIIASGEVGDFLGLKTGRVPADFVDKWGAYGRAIGTVSWATLAIGAATLATILAVRRLAPKWPACLIALLAATAAVALLRLPVETVGDRFHAMPTGLPLPRAPHFSLPLLRESFSSAFVIAFLAGIEALLSATVADGIHLPPPLGSGARWNGLGQHRVGALRGASGDRRDRPHSDQHSCRRRLTDGGDLPCLVPAPLHARCGQVARAGADGGTRRSAADGRLGDERVRPLHRTAAD